MKRKLRAPASYSALCKSKSFSMSESTDFGKLRDDVDKHADQEETIFTRNHLYQSKLLRRDVRYNVLMQILS
jgi:hypothetical protein